MKLEGLLTGRTHCRHALSLCGVRIVLRDLSSSAAIQMKKGVLLPSGATGGDTANTRHPSQLGHQPTSRPGCRAGLAQDSSGPGPPRGGCRSGLLHEPAPCATCSEFPKLRCGLSGYHSRWLLPVLQPDEGPGTWRGLRSAPKQKHTFSPPDCPQHRNS